MTFGVHVTITVFMPKVLVSRGGIDVASSLAYATIINIGGLIGAILASVFGYRFRRRLVLTHGDAVATSWPSPLEPHPRCPRSSSSAACFSSRSSC
jgi:hypothetical protein